MPRSDVRDDGATAIALTAAAGFAAGLFLGMAAGEWLGDVHRERVQGLLGRLRRRRRAEPAEPADPADLKADVREALREHPATRQLDLTVHSPGAGLVELTGMVPNAAARRTAGEVARAVDGADVVVNRILVEGDDVPTTRRTGSE